MNMNYDICIVGGAGHVGAPLAVVLANHGFRVLIYDLNQLSMNLLASGKMPFMEQGGDEMLRSALQNKMLAFSNDPSSLSKCSTIVITIGTPIDEFHNPRTSLLCSCINTLVPYIQDNSLLILRSTVAPGTTKFLDSYLKSLNKIVYLSFCPERVVQGKAIEEIQALPQLVSGIGDKAFCRASNIFSRIAPEIVEMSTLEAEYAKLICNAYRYIQFAATNQLYMMVENAGLNYLSMLKKIKKGYSRMNSIPGPGFAAGPCLMKDTMQLFAFEKHNFILGQVALTINEGLPNYLVSQIMLKCKVSECTIGILGMAFKPDCDDIRDSLSYKLKKILQFQGANVICSDEYVKDESFVSKEKLMQICDIIIVGVPHSAYKNLYPKPAQVVLDVWGVLS